MHFLQTFKAECLGNHKAPLNQTDHEYMSLHCAESLQIKNELHEGGLWDVKTEGFILKDVVTFHRHRYTLPCFWHDSKYFYTNIM